MSVFAAFVWPPIQIDYGKNRIQGKYYFFALVIRRVICLWQKAHLEEKNVPPTVLAKNWQMTQLMTKKQVTPALLRRKHIFFF